jgi:hypothetical protein
MTERGERHRCLLVDHRRDGRSYIRYHIHLFVKIGSLVFEPFLIALTR